MARDGDAVSAARRRAAPVAPVREEDRGPAAFGRLHDGPLNQWKVEERRA